MRVCIAATLSRIQLESFVKSQINPETANDGKHFALVLR